jgi:hypothetical protein
MAPPTKLVPNTTAAPSIAAIVLALSDGDGFAALPLADDHLGTAHRLALRVEQPARQAHWPLGPGHPQRLLTRKHQGGSQQQEGQQKPSLAFGGQPWFLNPVFGVQDKCLGCFESPRHDVSSPVQVYQI